MLYRLAGQPATFTIDFKVDGEFVVPDESSVTLTVLKGGVPETGYDATSLAVSTSTIEVEIAASVQTISQEFEPRWCRVNFKYANRSYEIHQPYKVHSFIAITATPEDVRNAFGGEYREIPDDDIDILKNYIYLSRVYGEPFRNAFEDAAASSSVNDALVLYTALEMFPQIRSRLLSRERNDTSEFERFKIDFEQLRLDLTTRFTTQLALAIEIVGGVVDTVGATYPSFAVTTPTDPFTGT